MNVPSASKNGMDIADDHLGKDEWNIISGFFLVYFNDGHVNQT